MEEYQKAANIDCGQKIHNALKKESYYTYKPDTRRRWGGGGAGYVSNEEIRVHARAGFFAIKTIICL
jgi:hypothetical protein